MSSVKPKMAAVYEDGSVCIYNAADGTVLAPGKTYSAGEVAAFCFDESDTWFLILTNTGELDIYDTETMELLFDEPVRLYRNLLRDGRSIWGLSAEITADDSCIYVQAEGLDSWSVFLDRTTWKITASVGEAYAYDPDTNKIFIPISMKAKTYPGYNGFRILSFPKYTIQDLKEWAEEEIQKEGA